jgi:serine/threonine-protein kinase
LSWFGTIAPREGLSRARAAAQNAVRLDKNLGLAHAILGAVHAVLDWNWTEAENSFQYAIAAQPGLALPYHLHANTCLLREGRIREAVTEIEHAVSLNPFDPILRAAAVHAYNLAGNYASAEENYDFGVEINPRTFLLHVAIGLAHQVRGQFDKAIAAFRTRCEVSGRAPLVVAALGHALAQSGQRQQAEALLPEVLSSAHPLAQRSCISASAGTTSAWIG